MIAASVFANWPETNHASAVKMSALGRLEPLLLGASLLAACSASDTSGAGTTAAICAPIAPTECPEPAPHYPDVAPIFEARCTSCHTGVGDAPWSLDDYPHVADWASFIRDELLRCSMPPPDSGVIMRPEERDLVLAWVRCGYPE